MMPAIDDQKETFAPPIIDSIPDFNDSISSDAMFKPDKPITRPINVKATPKPTIKLGTPFKKVIVKTPLTLLCFH